MAAINPTAAAAVIVGALALGGCAGGGFSFGGSTPAPEPVVQPAPLPELPSSIRATEVTGRWGYAAYHRDQDRARTEAAARGQCGHPVVINQGPSGGVMMYPADQSQLQEVWLKGGQGGRNFIGPHGPGGQDQDREVVAFDGRVMVLRYIDREINGRYGTGVYVRCAPRA